MEKNPNIVIVYLLSAGFEFFSPEKVSNAANSFMNIQIGFGNYQLTKNVFVQSPISYFPGNLLFGTSHFSLEKKHTHLEKQFLLALIIRGRLERGSSHRHGPAVCPAGSHTCSRTFTCRQNSKRMRTQPLHTHTMTQRLQGHLQTGLGRQL